MSIKIVKGTTYGFDISKATNKEWKVLNKHFLKSEKIRCYICNANTSKRLKPGLFANNIVTINNKIPDDVVYFNNIR